MDKKKRIIIASIVGAVVISGLIIFFIFNNKSVSNSNNPTNSNASLPDNQKILSLSASDIGLSLSLITSGKFAGHGVEMTISKLDNIVSIDYELSYMAQVAGSAIPRGALGSITIKPTDTVIDQQLPFGTCSDVCHYDSGVANIKMTLKITKNDGKVYAVEQSFNQ